jgi:hypothetical protein
MAEAESPAGPEDRTFQDWYREGRERRWVGEPWCYVHDTPRLTSEEDRIVEEEDGELDVICFPVARVGDTEDDDEA